MNKLETILTPEILKLFSKSTRIQRIMNYVTNNYEDNSLKFTPLFSGDPTQKYIDVLVDEFFDRDFEFTYKSTIEFEEGKTPDILCRKPTMFSNRLDKRTRFELDLEPVSLSEIKSFLSDKEITSKDEFVVFTRYPDQTFEVVSTNDGRLRGNQLFTNRYQDGRSRINLDLTKYSDVEISNMVKSHLNWF